jgi:hypothetical protein
MEMSVQFDTKIAVVLREDLAVWQKLNVTAFTVSAVAGATTGLLGDPYEDASGLTYLPMIRQPVLIFSGDGAAVRRAYERALAREVPLAIFTEDLFATGHDEANRAAVRAVASADLQLVGLAFRTDKRVADKVVKGLALHQ